MQVITYNFGNEHSPTDMFGRCSLVIEEDRSARLEHWRQVAEPRIWTAEVSETVLTDFAEALAKTNFPEKNTTPLIPDEIVFELSVGEETAWISGSARRNQPEYAAVLDLLDGIIFQVSGGSLVGLNSKLPEGSVAYAKQIQ